MPFQARRGLVMERWNSVAASLRTAEDFSRSDIDAKRSCNRFMLLLDAHRKSDKQSERASGIDEEVTEKSMLLDDLLAAYDDAKNADLRRTEESRLAAEHVDAMGSLVREEALHSLGKRKRDKEDDDGTSGGGKFMKMFTLMHEQAKADLEFKKEKLEKEREERRQELEERRIERQVLMEQNRQQQESMIMLIKMLMDK
ncbi:hypothetical protein B5M09_000654 [Aphanomyces astaci]|nr:hypothetical protein B5M09_000654 [Aphanomyces astaci]